MVNVLSSAGGAVCENKKLPEKIEAMKNMNLRMGLRFLLR
jgi:hypothetical protein